MIIRWSNQLRLSVKCAWQFDVRWDANQSRFIEKRRKINFNEHRAEQKKNHSIRLKRYDKKCFWFGKPQGRKVLLKLIDVKKIIHENPSGWFHISFTDLWRELELISRDIIELRLMASASLVIIISSRSSHTSFICRLNHAIHLNYSRKSFPCCALWCAMKTSRLWRISSQVTSPVNERFQGNFTHSVYEEKHNAMSLEVHSESSFSSDDEIRGFNVRQPHRHHNAPQQQRIINFQRSESKDAAVYLTFYTHITLNGFHNANTFAKLMKMNRLGWYWWRAHVCQVSRWRKVNQLDANDFWRDVHLNFYLRQQREVQLTSSRICSSVFSTTKSSNIELRYFDLEH